MPRQTVVIGLYGSNLDRTLQENRRPIPDRWDRWRPTVSLCQHEDFLPDRLELLAEPKFRASAEALSEDIASCSPETTVALHEVHFKNPWDFADDYPFDEDECGRSGAKLPLPGWRFPSPGRVRARGG